MLGDHDMPATIAAFWEDAYYINLDSRADRRAHIEAELSRVGLTATRFPAIGASPWQGHRPAPSILRKRTPGNSGCYLSHCALLQKIIISKKTTLILEDDCTFCDDLAPRLAYITQNLPAKWDIFFLNATFHYPTPYWHKTGDASPTDTPRIWRTYGLFGTQSLVINADSAAHLLYLMQNNLHHAYAIDHLLIQLQPRLQCFCYVPGCTTQYDNHSNITEKFAPFTRHHRLGPHVFSEKDIQCEPVPISPPSSSTTPSTESPPK